MTSAHGSSDGIASIRPATHDFTMSATETGEIETGEPREDVKRLAAFSDAVAAIAMTLLVLDLKRPDPDAIHSTAAFREAISQYGSAQEAARWVGTPTASAHVSGDAVDVGPADAMAWRSKHGTTYGLCRIYGNEPWHFELRPEAIGHACPPTYADPTHDPRMQP